jgi:hypothetical protein
MMLASVRAMESRRATNVGASRHGKLLIHRTGLYPDICQYAASTVSAVRCQGQTRCEAGTQSHRSRERQRGCHMKRRATNISAAIVANAFIALVGVFGLAGCKKSGNDVSPPIISDLPALSEAMVGQSFTLAPNASDPRGESLTFSVVNKPSWASFDTSTGRLDGRPVQDDVGTYGNVQIGASNGSVEALSNPFTIVVKTDALPVVNSAPTISGSPPQQVTEGQAYSFTPIASDTDQDTLTFSVDNKPAWASFSAQSGALVGTPPAGAAGSYPDIVISVSDGQANASLPAFTIVVDPATGGSAPPPANTAPTISGTPRNQVTEGQPYSFAPSAADADGDVLGFSISNKPSWAAFSTQTGALGGTPPVGAAGAYLNIVISVSDGQASAALPAFTLIVDPANRAPLIAGNPATSVREGSNYQFRPAASDADNDVLTFAITGKPSWASFNPSNGELAGTPPAGSAGSYPNIVISVSDGALSSSLPAFTLTVTANRSPTISGTPAPTATTGQAYSFTPSASDPEGDTLTFSITNKPSWASFGASTGRLSGTPGSADVGEHVGIVIQVSDGFTSSSLPSFSITVDAANRAPTIGGTPPTSIVEGQAYSFVPTASDADGDALTFSIVNKPSWASFSTSNGALSGTPGAGTVGAYADIRISVTDGKVSTSLPAFSVNVTQSAMGTATLSWAPPTTRTDGTPLTDLAGYRIHYGTSPGVYSTKITIDNSGITTYVIENLAPATYYFVTTAFDTTGGESDYSNVASKTIR